MNKKMYVSEEENLELVRVYSRIKNLLSTGAGARISQDSFMHQLYEYCMFWNKNRCREGMVFPESTEYHYPKYVQYSPLFMLARAYKCEKEIEDWIRA
jgi:hypothetical protein